MAEDPKLSQRYRELGREEPPPELDAAIRAAARRAVRTRPAPLVVPSGRRRWYFPLAAAAIIVLAVAVTMQVERERPDAEVVVPPVTAPRVPVDGQIRSEEAPVKPAAKPERARKAAPPPPVFVPEPKLEAPPVPAAPQAGAASGVMESRRADTARAMAKLYAEPPEKWLERIAELRKRGRHDEADKALAEFRRTYPDYRISAEMLEKVEKK